jgi:hypothetical protein
MVKSGFATSIGLWRNQGIWHNQVLAYGEIKAYSEIKAYGEIRCGTIIGAAVRCAGLRRLAYSFSTAAGC